MSRKRLLTFGLLVCAALVAASVAVAAKGGAAKSQAAAATFTASNVSSSKQTTCTVTGSDTFQTTRATYSGTSTSSDARMNGALVINARSVIDTTTGLGSVAGSYRIKGTKGSVHGLFRAAVDTTQAAGYASGETRRPAGHLMASFAGTFDPSTGFAAGSLGAGAATTGAGVVVNGGRCG